MSNSPQKSPSRDGFLFHSPLRSAFGVFGAWTKNPVATGDPGPDPWHKIRSRTFKAREVPQAERQRLPLRGLLAAAPENPVGFCGSKARTLARSPSSASSQPLFLGFGFPY